MADEDDIKARAKTALADKDAAAAVELLIDDEAHEIEKTQRNRLAVLAISDAYIAPHFIKVVGLISGDTVKKLCEDLGKHGSRELILEVLEDPSYERHRETIVMAMAANENFRTAEIYPFAISFVRSNDLKETLNTKLGRDVNVTNEEYASILGDPRFTAHRGAILLHVVARTDSDELEEFLDEVGSVLPDDEVTRLREAVERKRRYE